MYIGKLGGEQCLDGMPIVENNAAAVCKRTHGRA
jgi:hypothetical protein